MNRFLKSDKIWIAGCASTVPRNTVVNSDFEGRFSASEIAETVRVAGVSERRHVDRETTMDLCLISARTLLDDLGWEPGSIDALLFITQTPNQILPPSSGELQASLKLSERTICLDINLGCSAFPYGAWLASVFGQQGCHRVLVLMGDTISKIVRPGDRATALLFGDAGTATAFEFSEDCPDSYFCLGSDGTGAPHLCVPNSGFRKSDALAGIEDGAFLHMNGAEVFNFTLRRLPSLGKDIFAGSELPLTKVAGHLFHQANEFMLKHLIKKLGLSGEFCPSNISRFGNTSSASIPLLLCDYRDELVARISSGASHIAFYGFGVGFSWGAALIPIRPDLKARIVEAPGVS
jgi:3-oxoacyl-[acyl-carrier-protein] synthase-3